MTEEIKEPSIEPLSVIAGKIAQHAKKSEEHVIAAAMLIRDARRRVNAGEAGDVTWYEWAPRYIDLSMSRLRELQRIAEADDPEKELDRLRALNKKRVEKHRTKTAAQGNSLEEDRRRLTDWASSAPIADVRRMLDLIADTSSYKPSKRRLAKPPELFGYTPAIELPHSRLRLSS